MIWKKTGKTVHANGETEITYSPKNAGSTLVLFGGLHVESLKAAKDAAEVIEIVRYKQ